MPWRGRIFFLINGGEDVNSLPCGFVKFSNCLGMPIMGLGKEIWNQEEVIGGGRQRVRKGPLPILEGN